MATPTQQQIDAAVNLLIADSQTLHDVVNGAVGDTVTIGTDQVRTLRNAINAIVDHATKLDNDFSNVADSVNDPLRILGLDGLLKDGHVEKVVRSLDGLTTSGIYHYGRLTNDKFAEVIRADYPTAAAANAAAASPGDTHVFQSGIVLVIGDSPDDSGVIDLESSVTQIIFSTSTIGSGQANFKMRIRSGATWIAWTPMLGSGSSTPSATDPAALLTARGDIITRSAAAPQRLEIGEAGTVLKSDGTDVAWQPEATSGTKVVSVQDTPNGAGGYRAAAVVLSDGSIKTWGGTSFQQSGTGVIPGNDILRRRTPSGRWLSRQGRQGLPFRFRNHAGWLGVVLGRECGWHSWPWQFRATSQSRKRSLP